LLIVERAARVDNCDRSEEKYLCAMLNQTRDELAKRTLGGLNMSD
jgi:hypothetical protein